MTPRERLLYAADWCQRNSYPGIAEGIRRAVATFDNPASTPSERILAAYYLGGRWEMLHDLKGINALAGGNDMAEWVAFSGAAAKYLEEAVAT